MAKTATSMSSSAKNSSTTSSASSTASDSQASSESTTSDSTVSNTLSATTESDAASSSSSSSTNSSTADSSSSSVSDSSSASSTSGTYATIQAKDSVISVGTKWNAENNFTSATDENGNPLQISDLTVSGTVDPTKPGKYEITYSYTDGAGNQISKTITVTVVASKAAIDAKDSTITAENTWNASNNFISAKDENGRELQLSDLTISGKVDTQTPGRYTIVYSYTDSAGNTISKTITVTVIASQSPDNKNNDDSNVAPFNNDGSNENPKTNDGDNSNISGSSVKAKSLKSNKDQSSQTLPQTGEKQNTLMSVIGMLILALAGVGTLWGFKRHTKKDKQ